MDKKIVVEDTTSNCFVRRETLKGMIEMPAKKELDELMLRMMFCERNMILSDIGEYFKCDRRTIAKAIKERGLIRNYENPEWLRRKHHDEKRTIGQMAYEATCARNTIRVNMRKNKIDTLDEVRYSGVTKYTVDKNYFDTINTAEKAYWLGFIVADGGVLPEGNNLRLAIMLAHRDKNHLEKFKEAISSDAPIDVGVTKLNGQSYPYAKVRINSTDFCVSLMEHNVLPNKSTNEKVPTGLPEKFYKDFIRGFFDGDGSFSYWYDKQRKQFVRAFNVVGSHEIVSWIHTILSSMFKIRATVRQDGRIYRIDINSEETEKIMDWLYEGADVYLQRKHDKYEEWLSLREDIVRPHVKA